MDDNIENEPLSYEDADSTLLESIPILKEKINFFEIMIQQLNNRVASLEAINLPHVTSMAMVNQEYPAEWSLKSQKDYVTYAEKKLSLLKRDNEWRKNFLAIQFEGLSSESKDQIISAINRQRVSASRIVNTIAKEVLGVDAIKNYSIGCHGMAIAVGSSQMLSRPPLAEHEENRLRAVLGFMDKIFVTKDGWEHLVRKPVNQMGREFKSGKRDSFDIAELFRKTNAAKRPLNVSEKLTSPESNMAITHPDPKETSNAIESHASAQSVNTRDLFRSFDCGQTNRPLSSISSNFPPMSRTSYQATLDSMFNTISKANPFNKEISSKDGEKDKEADRSGLRYF